MRQVARFLIARYSHEVSCDAGSVHGQLLSQERLNGVSARFAVEVSVAFDCLLSRCPINLLITRWSTPLLARIDANECRRVCHPGMTLNLLPAEQIDTLGLFTSTR